MNLIVTQSFWYDGGELLHAAPQVWEDVAAYREAVKGRQPQEITWIANEQLLQLDESDLPPGDDMWSAVARKVRFFDRVDVEWDISDPGVPYVEITRVTVKGDER